MGPGHGWHKGERAMRRKMGFDEVMSHAWEWIESEMPEEHQVFYTTRLPFIPVTTIDDRNRPWSSILAGPDGQPGFATSQHLGELILNARVWEGDPFHHNVSSSRRTPTLIAGIGLEFSTRRRNKFAGYIESLENNGPLLRIQSVVNEAMGNCPKYINIRDLAPFSDTHPHVVYRRLDLSPDERLPDDVVSFIHNSDTGFLGTYYEAGEDEKRSPSHVGMNHRGGTPGFARVRPSDGRTLVIPDYSGNRLLSSLGNIEATPLAGITFVSFVTGAVLYLTGDARNLIGPAAQRLMPRINALTTIHVTGYILVEDALPIRQRSGTPVLRSPYSPPVRLLAEENTSTYFIDDQDGLQEKRKVTLTHVELHSCDIATFTFESPTRVDVIPGQAVVLDFKSFVGASPYQHSSPTCPESLNDDRIRTWTVSGSTRWAGSEVSVENADASSDSVSGPVSLKLTMRHKQGGVVTSALFAIAQKLAELRPELLEDARPLELTVPLVGVSGDFTLPTDVYFSPRNGKLGLAEQQPSLRSGGTLLGGRWLWIAGGIGLTPFLAMLAGLQKDPSHGGIRPAQSLDITFILSTREPDVLLPLVMHALQRTEDGRYPEHDERPTGRLSIHLFSRSSSFGSSSLSATTTNPVLAVEVTCHPGRLDEDALRMLDVENMRERQVYLCGPEGFERMVVAALKEMGVDSRNVRREEFAY